jgi:hypothetical protein
MLTAVRLWISDDLPGLFATMCIKGSAGKGIRTMDTWVEYKLGPGATRFILILSSWGILLALTWTARMSPVGKLTANIIPTEWFLTLSPDDCFPIFKMRRATPHSIKMRRASPRFAKSIVTREEIK